MIHSQINLYADDTELHHCGHSLSSVQHGFQCDLDGIYFNNVSKSVAMLIGTRQKINHHNVSVQISGQTLTQVSYTKYLGIYIDHPDLSTLTVSP